MPNRKTYYHIEANLDFRPLKSITTEDQGRYYITPDNEKFYSVTTVTGFEKSQFFAEWRKNNLVESRRVTKRGNLLHEMVEKYINNEEVQPYPECAKLFNQMIPMLHKIDNIYAQEVPMFSKLLGLAGRVDCVAEYDGVKSIIDFKGSTRKKREYDIENYFLQTTAYSIMWKEMTGKNIDQIVVLVSSEDGTTQEFIRDPIDYVPRLKDCIQKFREFKQQSVAKAFVSE